MSSVITMATDTVSPAYNWTFRRVVWATLVLVSVIFCFWLLYRFYQVLFILFVAIVIGTVIRPIVTWLYAKGMPRIVGVILVFLLLLILLAGFLWLLFPLIFEQSSTLAKDMPNYYQSLRTSLIHYPNSLLIRVGQLLPGALPSLNAPVAQTGEQVVASAGQVLGYILSVAQVIFTTIVILVLTV